MKVTKKQNIEPIFEGDELYRLMLKTMENAKNEILLESYIFEADPIGNKFIELLNKKAKENIIVKLHLDSVGSRYFYQHNLFREKLDKRIKIKWFHRWSWKRPLQFNIRNHRKLLIIDRRTVFIGGYNIHQTSSRENIGETRWRDTHVMIESEVAQLFFRYFESFWLKKRQRYYGPLNEFDLIPNLTYKCRYLFRCKLTRIINQAKSTLLCTTPYFIPDDFILRALLSAAQRGVIVRILVPFESDHPIVNSLTDQYYARLLQSGIQIHAYVPRLLHAKTLVVDSETVMIGSANMDYRSLFINHELVCFFTSKVLVKKMTERFIDDCTESVTISTKRPLKKIKHWWLWRPLAAMLKHWL